MTIIEPSHEILLKQSSHSVLSLLELAGRTCYKSEGKITEDSASKFVHNVCSVRKHESVMEHASMTVKFVCDRGVSHELVRHRLASFSQESTRYCNYGDKGMMFIRPPWVSERVLGKWKNVEGCETDLAPSDHQWFESMRIAEEKYNDLLALGWSPQQARSVLPNSLKTEVIMTANMREWKHVFSLRCAPTAHPQMVQLMAPLRDRMVASLPELFT